MSMAGADKDEIPMLSRTFSQFSDGRMDLELQRFTPRNRSASMSIPMNSVVDEREPPLVSYTGPLQSERRPPFPQMSGPLRMNRKSDNVIWPMLRNRAPVTVERAEYSNSDGTDNGVWPDGNGGGKNDHLLRSGPLGMCNDPYCTTCPTYFKAAQQKKTSSRFESKLHSILSEDAKGWMRRFISFLGSYVPGIMNPHARVVQQWNKFYVISCLVAIFVDPLFFFLLSVHKENKCIILNWPMATTVAVVRSLTDFVYFLHMLLQFRLAYVAPESKVVGAGELVDQPKKIALHYLYGYFSVDLFVVLPLPQIMILFVLPQYVGSSAANYAKNLLRATVLLQYIPRFYRFLPLLSGRSASGFIFETARANFIINLLIFVLAGHVVGSSWYLFGLQRVNHCLHNACKDSKISHCNDFIDCGKGNNVDRFIFDPFTNWTDWKNNENATDCLNKGGNFTYGIYGEAVKITIVPSIVTRYIYALFWGFQQISTLAGNQTPSDFVWEVLFTMGIVGLGLFLFALLIGNMQNFLQALGRRRLEMQLRHRDVEQWMSHRRLPQELRRQVRQYERFNWAATRGVNEEVLIENLPEDLQREIRRHLFKFVKKVRIFALMEGPILDAICERSREKLYIKGSKIIYYGGVVDKMIFIVRGKMESVDVDGNTAPLFEGDICGEELLTWCLDHSSVNREGQKVGHRFISNRTVTCLTNVEAFALRITDLEEVTAIFARYLRNPRVQGAIRYVSPYWRVLAASRIQVAWRYRKKRLSRGSTFISFSDHVQVKRKGVVIV